MRVTVHLEEHLIGDLEAVAAERGMTLAALIEEVLRQFLLQRRNGRDSQRHPIYLPTHGTGGLQPGVKLDDSAALWELTEDEHASS